MSSKQYQILRFANYLATEQGYDVLYINKKDQEIFLEKYEQQTSTVIRLVHKGFDWKNHLKVDIAQLFQRISSLKKLLVGRRVKILNVYLSDLLPVDDWEILTRPLKWKNNRAFEMNVFYLSDENFDHEWHRLTNHMNVDQPIHDLSEVSAMQLQQDIEQYENYLIAHIHAKRQKITNVFSFGKPVFVYIFMAINIFMYFILEMNGGSVNPLTLIYYGAKVNPLMMEGEWWRLITSMFLHSGFLHIFMNMLALYYLGVVVERMYGSMRFFIIYFMAGLGGSLTSFAFTDAISVGASGAIFGLFGALLFFGVIHQKLFLQTMGKGILLILAINLAIGLIIPEIDMGAHLGGLLAGFLAAAGCHLPNEKVQKKYQLLSVIGLFVLCLALLLLAYGISHYS